MDNNPEIQGTKSIIDETIGESTFISKKRKTQDNKKMKEFFYLINTLEQISIRSKFLIEEVEIDLGGYDSKYWEVIHIMLENLYGKEIQSIIAEYLVSKFDNIELEYNLEDIWNEIKKVKSK